MLQTNRALIVLILLLLISSSVMVAQSGAGRLHGQVADPSAAVIPGASVVLKTSTGATITAQSDGEGNYDLKNVPPGKYTLTISEKGFRPFTQEVEIAAGQSKKLDATLEIAAKQEEIDVQGDAAKVSVNPDSNSSSVVIGGKDLDALSDDPDELQSELQALAGPSAGPNGGQIYIDGFTGGQLPPKASIREIRINQNPFSAEYDRMGFGRIEILTKPGTDKLHGQVFYNDNHSIFDALNPFAATEPDFSSKILNANVGGPLNKKASYFLNFERRNIDDAAIIHESAFTAAGEPVVGVANPRVRTNISSRLDYQLSGSNTLTARYQFTNDDEQNNGFNGSQGLALPSQAFNQTNIEHTIQLSDTQILSAKAVNETRFEWQRDDNEQNAVSAAPEIIVPGVFINGGNTIGNTAVISNHYELQNYTSLNLNTHFLRLGGRLRATAETNTSTQNFNGTFTFTDQTAFNNGTPSQLTIVRGNPTISDTFVDAGIYAEDDWKLRPNMTLSYGLRFETQNGIHDHGDWAPRLGFAWGVGGKKNGPPKMVIRTGFGLFYDRFSQNLILQSERLNGVNQQQFVIANPSFPNIPDLSTLTGFAPTIYSINPNLKAPYTVQFAGSVERQVTKTSTLSVTYLHSHGVHQLFSSVLSSAPSPQYQYQSGGVFNQNQLIANIRILAGRRLTLFSYYSLSFANGNTSGAGSFPSDPVLGIAADYGRTAYDVRNRIFLGGSIGLPKGFRVSPFIVATSGAPFNITLGDDLNGDSIFNDRPAFATGTSTNIMATAFGTFDLSPLPGQPRIPINFGTSPALATVNMRVSKTFGIGPKTEATNSPNQRQGEGGPRGGPGGGRGPGPVGGGPGRGGPLGNLERTDQRYNLTLSLNVRNILNTVNPGPPIGTLSSPNFGQSFSLAGGPFNTQSANRRLDMQVMFSF